MNYDVIVIGGGSAGLVAAKFVHGLGKRTAIVEKRKLGGDCTHYGCVPSKALIHLSGTDKSNVMSMVRALVDEIYSHETPDVLRGEGIDVIEGSPVFDNSSTITVNNKKYTAKKFILCTGSSPLIPDIKGLSDIDYLTNETLFGMDELPESIAVLGGGPIGVEMAFALNRLGVDTAIIEMAERILPRDDQELSERLRAKLEADGIKILTGTKVAAVRQADGFAVLETSGAVDEVRAVRVLAAAGRVPNLKGLALERAGVEYDRNGVRTDRYLRTTAKNIYAAGDIVPPYKFTHVADYEAVTAVRNALLPFRKAADYSCVGWCTYTEPELAGFGLTEKEAAERYGSGNIRVFRYDYKGLDRAITDFAAEGLAKYITDRKGRILGAHMLGNRAGETIHEVMLAKRFGIRFQKIADMVHIYPTYSYAVRQPSKYAAVEMLMDNYFIKLIRRLRK